MRAQGMGANVIVTEVKATAALKATLEGCRVMPMEDAAAVGDIFVTATGMKDVIRGEHFVTMKEGAIVCNTGHYDCEINIGQLEGLANENQQLQKRQRDFYLDNDSRLKRLEGGAATATPPAPPAGR